MQLCNVLEDLNGFLWEVRVQMGVEGENRRKTMKHNLMEVKVSVNRLQKALALWWRHDRQNQMRRSTLPLLEQSRALINILAGIFPENVAEFEGNRWFAAGHCVRGGELQAVDGERRVFLFNPRPIPWPKSADHEMAHLKAL